MLTIHSNGSKWAGDLPDPIEKLYEVLTREPLDRKFECWGNFITTSENDAGVSESTHFFGNFFNLSHVFRIDTDEPEIIARLTELIRANQQTPEYLAQHEPVAANRKAALRDTVWIYAKVAKRHSTASNGEKLVKLRNGHTVRLWDMSEELMNVFVQEVRA